MGSGPRPRTFVMDTVALAVRPDDVEDQLWDHHPIFASGRPCPRMSGHPGSS